MGSHNRGEVAREVKSVKSRGANGEGERSNEPAREYWGPGRRRESHRAGWVLGEVLQTRALLGGERTGLAKVPRRTEGLPSVPREEQEKVIRRRRDTATAPCPVERS